MKKYLVIGNPIEHSLSPQIHNFWIKNNNIDAVYEKIKLDENEIKDLVLKIRDKKIDGINVTVPFKKKIISYLDELSPESEITQSVNTIYSKGNRVIGHNTDIGGFELGVKYTKFDVANKKIFILGAGGVVPSIIFSLNKMKAFDISITNRTKDKALTLKNSFKHIKIIDWGEIPNFDMIINATSIGLNHNDKISLNFSGIEKKKFFYDIIYKPKETNFLKEAKQRGNQAENGKKMFIYQAAEAFKIWHGVQPKIDDELIKYLDQ